MNKKFRKGIFMVTYAIKNGKPLYVIQFRKLHWKGWEFPKGGVEKFELNTSAVKREIKEETGLKIKKITNHKLKGKFFYTENLKDRPGIVAQTYVLFSVEVEEGKIKIDTKEHSKAKWMKYEEAMKKLKWQDQQEALKIVHVWLVSKLK